MLCAMGVVLVNIKWERCEKVVARFKVVTHNLSSGTENPKISESLYLIPNRTWSKSAFLITENKLRVWRVSSHG
jgi:hypothetical protein